MTDKVLSPLRRRMIEDMTIRKLAPKTQQGYIRTIKDLAVFLGRSPDTASPSARVLPPRSGSPSARPIFYLCRIITCCSRCRHRSPTSPTRTKP